MRKIGTGVTDADRASALADLREARTRLAEKIEKNPLLKSIDQPRLQTIDKLLQEEEARAK